MNGATFHLSNMSVFCADEDYAGATHCHSRKLDLAFLLYFILKHGPESFTCADRRDYVYSLLGLAEGAQGFAVDYRTTTVSLFLDTIQHFKLMAREEDLELSPFGILKRVLQVTVSSYCRACAEPIPHEIEVISRGLGEEYVFALLTVKDGPNTTMTTTNLFCETCSKGRLIPEWDRHLDNKEDYPQHLFRVGADKMYCLTHKKRFYPWERTIELGLVE
jgi:hypothetical protein